MLLLSILTGCTKSINFHSNNKDIILYNRFSQKLIKYNLDSKKALTLYDQENIFEYEFANNDNLYVVGHSINNDFKLLQITDNDKKVLFELNSSEAMFPLATDNKSYFFIHSYYDDNKCEITSKRCISKLDLDSKNLKNIETTIGLIEKGTILGNDLYYTEYNTESDDYSLYKININSLNTKPKSLNKHLESGEVYNDESQIWIKTEGYLIPQNNNLKINAAFLNYFIEDYIFQIDTNHNGDMSLQIVERNTCEIKYKKDKIYDFKKYDSKIIIYGDGFIEEFIL